MGWDQHDDQGLPPGGDPHRYGEAGDPLARGDEPTRIVPRRDEHPLPAPDQWITQDLPPSFYASQPPVRVSGEDPARRRQRPWVIAICALLAVAVIAGGALVFVHPFASQGNSKKGGPDCAGSSACKAADGYLTAYSGGNFEGMYAFTSQASRTRFSTPAILHGAYKDAHDYIVNRSAALIGEARVSSIGETQGATKQTSDTQATVPAEIVMTSSRLGTFTEDITLPLVSENGQWRVQWSPGLLFPKLDDPTYDPNYTRLVHLFTADGNRGTIFDRDGNVLAKDDTVFTVSVIPGQIKNESNMLAVLGAALDFTSAQLKAKYAGRAAGDTVPIRTVPPQLFSKNQSQLNALVGSGVTITNATGRVYPYGTDTAAVTGYVSSVTADDLKGDTAHYYEDGDVVGRAGVEAWGEESLRAVRGGKLDVVNRNADGTFGAVAYTLAARQASAGQDIHTTLQLKNQQATMAALRREQSHGSGVVAVDPITGAVLVLASNPIYDPNDFALGFTPNGLARFNALDHPYLNRALSASVPTGSVFKIVTLSAALENGISKSEVFTCPGSFTIPGTTIVIHEPEAGGHGSLTAPQALPPSCDIIFAKVAVQLNAKDPNVLSAVARGFGFGAPTGMIGVPDGVEASGLVPDPQYLRDKKNAQWTNVDAANLGIGQGDFEATPAQVAMMAAAVGNGGKRLRPYLVASMTASDGTVTRTFGTQQVGALPVSSDTLTVVQSAMLSAVAAPNGTSYYVWKGFPLRVAGKTGTAESGQDLPHAWFACYAPASPLSGPPVTPTIAMGVAVFFAGFGASDAAPVSRQLLTAYFHL